MSIFDKLKDFGLLEKDSDTVDSATTEQSVPAESNQNFSHSNPSTSSSATPATPYIASDNVAAGSPDPKYLETLQKEIDSVCSDSYRNFQKKLVEMGKITAMPPQAQFQAAMIAASITEAQIRQNHDAMLAKLVDEENNFKSAIEGKHTILADETNGAINNLKATIESNNKQIQDLNNSNTDAFAQIGTLSGKIADSEAKTQTRESSFRASAAQLRAKVEQDRNQAAQYIPQSGGAK